MMRRIPHFLPGFLAFLGYYEIVSGLAVPLRFTVERVTNTYLARLPLLGALEADLVAFVVASSILAQMEDERRLRMMRLVIIASAASLLLICRILDLTDPAYMVLGSASLLSALIHIPRRGLSILIPGALLSAAALEASSLASLATYFALGGWEPIPFQVILRERLVWAPLEWACVPIFIAWMWVTLGKMAMKGPSRRLLKPSEIKAVDEGGSRRLLAISTILTTLFLVLVHLPSVNPEFKPVSVDTANYKSLFDRVGGEGLREVLKKSSERPLFIILVYHLWQALSGDAVMSMDLVYPIIALNLLAVASYYLGLRLGGPSSAGWASLLVPLGYAVPAFIGGGFQANSLALTTAILTLTIDPKSLGGFSKLSALLTLTALIHPWTYFMYASALAFKGLRDRRGLAPTLLALAISYSITQAVDYSLGAVIVVEAASRPVTASWGLHLPASWFDAIQFYVWNAMSNPLYLTASLLTSEPCTSSITAVAAPFTAILPSGLVFRLLLNLPTQLQASFTIKTLKQEHRRLIFLFLTARVIGNLSGLTPLKESV